MGSEGLGEPGSCNQPCGPGHVSFQKRLGVAGTSLEVLGKALEAETGDWEPHSPQQQALSLDRRQNADPPPSCGRSKGCRDGP